LASGTGSAEPRSGTVSFTIENDAIADQDWNYTSGLLVSFVSAPGNYGGVTRFIADKVLFAGENDRVRYGYALGQSIYTPDELNSPVPLLDQHPFAGWLYAEYSVFVQRPSSSDRLALQMGVVGPSAGGEWLQDAYHSYRGFSPTNGWRYQLSDEFATALFYEHRGANLLRTSLFGLETDLVPSWGASVGNVRVDANAGLTFRLGSRLPKDSGPPRVRPGLGGAGFFDSEPGISWYIFAGVEGRAVARDIFLDGNTFNESARVDKNPFVGDAQAGFVLQRGDAQLAFTFVQRSPEFETQGEAQRFGSLSLLWNY
jgi:hypothetical protein